MLLKDGKELHIRKAVKADAQEILDYLNIVGGESDNLLFGANEFTMTVEQEELFIESLRDSETSALFGGFIRDKIVCVGSALAPARERISHQCEIAISVLKEYWGIGVGTCLMTEVIGFAKESGKLEVLHLGVKAENTSAIALYRKLGFQEIGRFPRFFRIKGEYYDEILMSLHIKRALD